MRATHVMNTRCVMTYAVHMHQYSFTNKCLLLMVVVVRWFFFKRLCRLQCESSGSTYSIVMSLLRARLSFSLLRSRILCIRGTRSRRGFPVQRFVDSPVVVAESRLFT